MSVIKNFGSKIEEILVLTIDRLNKRCRRAAVSIERLVENAADVFLVLLDE